MTARGYIIEAIDAVLGKGAAPGDKQALMIINTENREVAQLFDVYPASGERPVIMLASNLFADPSTRPALLGTPPGFVGHEPDSGLLEKRFSLIEEVSLSPQVYPALVGALLDKQPDMPPELRDAWKELILQRLPEGFDPNLGARGFLKVVNDIIAQPLTPQQEQELAEISPAYALKTGRLNSKDLSQAFKTGTQVPVKAPKVSRFSSTPKNTVTL